ncbi:hypothetical protein NODU109028_05830 [Nocardioides dubius]|uniref:Collagen triple helix repeat-containing protein n=1 Tax=Nocardioides dubius TaxID=317019 RepID=A0ABN1U1M9_9ACTN
MFRIRRGTYANVTATLALALALGGTAAVAAEKIGGSQIAKNAITSKHVKNGQIGTADLSAAARRGMVGPRGAAGAAGAPGAPGVPGAPGISGHQVVSAESSESDADGWSMVSVLCPLGKKALGYGTSWRNVAGNTMTLFTAHATVSLNPSGTGYNAYGEAAGPGAWLTLQVVCADVS